MGIVDLTGVYSHASRLFLLVFATNFRVKAAMKNSILLSWEIRDKNPSQPFTVRTFPFDRAS